MSENGVTILCVDDEPAVRTLLRRCFESERYHVIEASNRDEMLAAFDEQYIDLITLDITLGEHNGLDLAREIRAVSDVGIIVVSGKGDLIDTVVGLEVGADDYISKPFEVREVLARARSVLRRAGRSKPGTSNRADSASAVSRKTLADGSIDPTTGVQSSVSSTASIADAPIDFHVKNSQPVYRFAHWVLMPAKRCLLDADGAECALTTAEFDLLEVLVRNSQTVMSRDRIMDGMRGQDWSPNDRTIDNQIARLRKKIDPGNALRAIKSVRGVGYVFTLDVS